MGTARINARLDEETARDLEFVREALGGLSVTEAVKYALKQAAEEIRDRERARVQKQIWIDSGFVGGFEGPEDLSANYKQYFAEIMDEKYADEQQSDR